MASRPAPGAPKFIEWRLPERAGSVASLTVEDGSGADPVDAVLASWLEVFRASPSRSQLISHVEPLRSGRLSLGLRRLRCLNPNTSIGAVRR